MLGGVLQAVGTASDGLGWIEPPTAIGKTCELAGGAR